MSSRKQRGGSDNQKLRAFDNSSKHRNNDKLDKEMKAQLETLSLKDHRVQTERAYEIMQAKMEMARRETARQLINAPRKMSLLERSKLRVGAGDNHMAAISDDEDYDEDEEVSGGKGQKNGKGKGDSSDDDSDNESPRNRGKQVSMAATRPHTTNLAALRSQPITAGQRQVKSAAPAARPGALSSGGEQAKKRVRYILRARNSAPARSRRQIRAQLETELAARRQHQRNKAQDISDMESKLMNRWSKSAGGGGGRPSGANKRPITLEDMLTVVIGREERSVGELKKMGHIDVMVEMEKERRRKRILDVRQQAENAKKLQLSERVTKFFQALESMKQHDDVIPTDIFVA